MNAGGRLALYSAGLAVAFGGAFALAGALVPDSVVTSWEEESAMKEHAPDSSTAAACVPGLSLDADGYSLSPIQAPQAVAEAGELRFQIVDAAGTPLTSYATTHEKDLHLIVVRADGTHFQHVHPVLNTATGTWSVPWTWDAAGTYRVFADATPAGEGARGFTLTRTIDVAGELNPVEPTVQRTDEVAGFTVTLAGDLVAGAGSELTLSITRDGQPVTTVEPYLGAFGHLVALRVGDLAYLHVHPQGDEPGAHERGGPDIRFTAHIPTAGRYLLYLDFQIDGQVHTAQFVVDAGHGDGTHAESGSASHSGDH